MDAAEATTEESVAKRGKVQEEEQEEEETPQFYLGTQPKQLQQRYDALEELVFSDKEPDAAKDLPEKLRVFREALLDYVSLWKDCVDKREENEFAARCLRAFGVDPTAPPFENTFELGLRRADVASVTSYLGGWLADKFNEPDADGVLAFNTLKSFKEHLDVVLETSDKLSLALESGMVKLVEEAYAENAEEIDRRIKEKEEEESGA